MYINSISLSSVSQKTVVTTFLFHI